MAPTRAVARTVAGAAAKAALMAPTLVIRLTEAPVRPVAETLGEHVFDFFLRNKREEWQDYRRQVTEYELGRYLPML